MQDWRTYFKGKKITVMGAGLLGGVGDILFLSDHCAELIITDLKNEEDLRSSLTKLSSCNNVRYTLNRHDFADFENRDLIIMAPATPLDSPYIAHAREHKIPITTWSALFARFARQEGAEIVGLTGTRGKTTTTLMIVEILKAAGKKVIVGGNIPGISLLPQLVDLTKDTIVVLELDSWKIQGFREEQMSPDIAVFTTFYADHLNYYKGDMDAYLADKAEIFLHQDHHNTLILGNQCAELVQKKYGDKILSKIIIADDIPSDWSLTIPGGHNRLNAACALEAARVLNISDIASKQALEHFKGVSGRLEFAREIRGVKFYNDTAATTSEATIAALRALPAGVDHLILIMGGADKELIMDELIKEIPRHVKKLILLSGTGTEKIRSNFPDAPVFDSLPAAVDAAYSAAHSGDTVLLSPAFASFGMFKNEYDRGDQFVHLVNELQ